MRILAALICTLVLFALAATGVRADDALTVIGGSLAPNLLDVPDFVALEAGFFKEQHFDVTKEFLGSASAGCLQLLAAGKGDVCSASMEPIISGYEKGVRLQLFFNRDPRYDYVIAVLADSPIRTLADFKGKTIGEYAPGSAAEVSANAQLMGAGLRRSDYAYLPIGGGAQALFALTSKKVDGVAFPDGEFPVDAVVGHAAFRFFRNQILDDVPNVGYMSTTALIAAKADQLQRYARALAEADLFIHYNPTAAARYFLEGAGQKVTPDALATIAREIAAYQDSYPGADPSSKRIGAFPMRGVALYCRYMYDAGLTHELVPATAVVTNAFVPFANAFDHRAVIAQAAAANEHERR
jgi:NitT/TauT family transport system substrate-binding protein